MSGIRTDPTSPLPPPGGTTFVALSNAPMLPFTLVRETDCRTAMSRGLKEYIEQLSMDWVDGKQERFAAVFDTWAEAEDRLQYPAAAIYATDPLEYSNASMSPSTETDVPTNTQYTRPSEVMVTLNVELWCQDQDQRMAIVAMLEDAFTPVEWMYGFRLDLPHYHSMRAEYMPTAVQYLDDAEDAKRRYRKALFMIQARMPQVRVLGKGVPMRTRAPMTFNDGTVPTRVAGPAPDTKSQE